MAQIIRQPDGKLMVFDGRTGRIELWDANEDDVVKWFRTGAEIRAQAIIDLAVEQAQQHLDLVRQGKSRELYDRHTMTWDQAVEDDRDAGGEASAWFAANPPTPAKG